MNKRLIVCFEMTSHILNIKVIDEWKFNVALTVKC